MRIFSFLALAMLCFGSLSVGCGKAGPEVTTVDQTARELYEADAKATLEAMNAAKTEAEGE